MSRNVANTDVGILLYGYNTIGDGTPPIAEYVTHSFS